jgi:hypothetical protein
VKKGRRTGTDSDLVRFVLHGGLHSFAGQLELLGLISSLDMISESGNDTPQSLNSACSRAVFDHSICRSKDLDDLYAEWPVTGP